MYPSDPKACGGALLNKRKARLRPRPLDTKNSMHLVLRSTQAKGDWSFSKKLNRRKIDKILERFSQKHAVKILSMAYVGNHLHFHIRISSRAAYLKYIKAITSAIVMAVTGINKFKKLKKHFWDLRPYTRIVFGERARQILKNYIEINQLESFG